MSLLTPEQLQRWEQDGYLVIPDFYSSSETDEMLARARQLLADFDPSQHPLTRFTTAADGEDVGDDYFLSSGDKIRYFLEPSALAPATSSSTSASSASSSPSSSSASRLLVPPEQSINKIGHALAVLDPTFRRYTLGDERVKQVARDLAYHKDPKVLQSMIICKQPRIGGVVPVHNDSTFLYTDPPSAVGCWVALEACTAENGCLSFLPGSHKTVRIHTRFVRSGKSGSNSGTTFEDVPGVEKNTENWDEAEGWKPAPVSPGSLVLIHGNVMHRSPPNPSDKSRLIYTFHMIEGEGAVYDEKNWLQPTPEMPFPSLLA